MACLRVTVTLATLLTVGGAQAAEDRFANVKVESQHVAGTVHMLTGAGGNIGVSVGTDGTMIVDDQFAPLGERIEKALKSLGGDRPRLVLNTHYHGDHTGSNEYFGTTATIIGHANLRRSLAESEKPRAALPLVTFLDRLTLHINDEEIEVIHLPNGHTDTDSVVWFKRSNVVHMGDHYFNGFFPFIDVAAGGSVEGFIANISAVIDMVPEDAQVIPGHGPLSNISELSTAQNVARHAYEIANNGLSSGKAKEDIVKALDAKFGKWAQGFISSERWVDTVAASNAAKTP